MGDNDHVQPATLFLLLLLTQAGQPMGMPANCPTMCLCHATQTYCDNQGLAFVPRFQRKVTVIYLRNNAIKRLRMTWFDNLPRLQHLLLKNNLISRIDRGTFLNLTSLVSLSLSENHLRRLPIETFYGLRQLRAVSLRDNRLTRIDNIFLDLTNVQLINIADNRIRRIGRRAFETNTRLTVLDAHNNSITSVHRRTFRYLPLLKFLVLRDNPIKTIAFDFRPNFHLELLDLANCRLRRVARGIPYSVRDLRMSENNITWIDRKDFRRTRQIQVLDLNQNLIGRIHRHGFAGLRVLINLYIGKNRIKSVPRNLPVSLRGLYANFNDIERVPRSLFASGSKLENLYLNNNKIGTVHRRAFDELHNLRSLDLNSNSISLFSQHTFCNLSSLDLLDLSNNPITRIEQDCFVGLNKLRIFQLASIRNDVPFARLSLFKGMRNLQFLDMHATPALTNDMERDAFYEDYLDTVTNLNLMANKLRSLPSHFPSHFPSLRTVKLSGNPWHCDTSIYWLVKWLRNNTVSFFAPEHITCETPPVLKGRRVMHLHENELKKVQSAAEKLSHASHKQTESPEGTVDHSNGTVHIPVKLEKHTFTVTKQTALEQKQVIAPVLNSNATENRPRQIGSQMTEAGDEKNNNKLVGAPKTTGQKLEHIGSSGDAIEEQNRTTSQLEGTHLNELQNLTGGSPVVHKGSQNMKDMLQEQPNAQTKQENSQQTTNHPAHEISLHHAKQTVKKPEQSRTTSKPRYLSPVSIRGKTKSWQVAIDTTYSDKMKGQRKLEKDSADGVASFDKHKFDNDIE